MKLVWLDVETTGLDPQNDRLLEVAMVGPTEVVPFECLVRLPEDYALSAFIRDMHTKNSLLAEAASTDISDSEAEQKALDWISAAFPDAGMGELTLAGSSVHFDLGFLQVHMPNLARCFSHRLFDVSAIKLFCNLLGMPPLPKAEAHRALADIRESHEHMCKCRDWLGR